MTFKIWSADKFLKEEVEYIGAVFYHKKIIKEVKQKPNITEVENDEQGDKKHMLVLSHKDDKGNHPLRSMKKYLRKLISKKSTLQITCTG